MSVGAWGYGTGATGTGAHPFCLRIQGVDVIDSVPLESISVNASVSSNATLTFDILDSAGTMTIPPAWSDVELLDTTEQEWLFGGLVMGVEVTAWATTGRLMCVRCVDYGKLLDAAPLANAVGISAGISALSLATATQAAVGAAPLGGLTAVLNDSHTEAGGRLTYLVTTPSTDNWYAYVADDTANGDTASAGASARATISGIAERAATVYAATFPDFSDCRAVCYVMPDKRLAMHPVSVTFGTAPLRITQSPTLGTDVAPEQMSVDYDYGEMEAGVFVSDTDTSTGGDNSMFISGTVNGYAVASGSVSGGLTSAADAISLGRRHLVASGAPVLSASATVVTTKNFLLGQEVTVVAAQFGINGAFPVTGTSTRFLGGSGGYRRTTVTFPATSTSQTGERETFSRWNRKRHARAGVYS